MKLALNEDRLPKQLHVIFSSDVLKKMDIIENYNQNNLDGIALWYDYIEGIKRWLSNPSIAWDYANRFAKFPNGSRYIRDFNYNIGYTVKTNQYGAYVYVFMINLNPQQFGLKIPPSIKENKIIYTNNTMKTNKKIIRLSESKLKNIVSESIKAILRESKMSPKQAAYELSELTGMLYNELQDEGSVTLSENDVYRLDGIGTVLGEYFGVI